MRYVLHTTVEQGHSPVEGIEHSSDSLPQHVVVAGPGADWASPGHEVLKVACSVAGLSNGDRSGFQLLANHSALKQQQNPTRVERPRSYSSGKKAKLPIHAEHLRMPRPENGENVDPHDVEEACERVRVRLVRFPRPVLKHERADAVATQRPNQVASKTEGTSPPGPAGVLAGRGLSPSRPNRLPRSSPSGRTQDESGTHAGSQ